ncbi:MAG: YdcF family protein, partial [Acidimicrobiales bacterium]
MGGRDQAVMGLHPLRWALRLGVLVVTAVLVYLLVTLVQVWHAAGEDQARPAQAIVVLGAAQYNGHPSPVLRARLDHAYDLWSKKLAPIIVVTGGRAPGDQHTEAEAGANYLAGRGVPQAEVLREVTGRDSWQSLAAAARFLEG